MTEAHTLVVAYGYVALFAAGFVEFVGAPVGAAFFVLAAGALSASGDLSLPWVVASTAAGGLSADLFWYSLARLRSEAVMRVACGLSVHPRQCVLTVRDRVSRLGAPFLVVGKFLPGTAGLTAAAAGLAPLPAPRFVAFDTAALLFWTILWASLGRLFSDQIQIALHRLLTYGSLAFGAAAGLVAAVAVARWAKMRAHGKMH